MARGDTLGFVYDFAGSFTPHGAFPARGQFLPISAYSPLFALPNLDGRTVIGGSGLYPEGDAVGADNFLLTSAELPAEVPVPEPATWATMALGFAAIGFFALRRGCAAPAAA
jgi:microcystin-dependent protein